MRERQGRVERGGMWPRRRHTTGGGGGGQTM